MVSPMVVRRSPRSVARGPFAAAAGEDADATVVVAIEAVAIAIGVGIGIARSGAGVALTDRPSPVEKPASLAPATGAGGVAFATNPGLADVPACCLRSSALACGASELLG